MSTAARIESLSGVALRRLVAAGRKRGPALAVLVALTIVMCPRIQ